VYSESLFIWVCVKNVLGVPLVATATLKLPKGPPVVVMAPLQPPLPPVKVKVLFDDDAVSPASPPKVTPVKLVGLKDVDD